MNWHEEVLDAGARKAADRLVSATADRFYLAGGTGLALRLGHRISLDLDLFSAENALREGERLAVREALKASGGLDIRENKDGTCHFLLSRTMVSLFHYPYPLLKPASPWRGLPVAALEDIAAMKLSAIIGRGAKKDFMDIYAVCREIGLEAVLESGVKKYADHSNFAVQALRASVYFEDAEDEPMPRLIKKFSWDEVKAYFQREVPRVLKKLVT